MAIDKMPLEARFDPFSQETLARPYAFYAALRAEAPVWQDPATGIFIVSKAADVRAVAMNPRIFSSATRDAMRASSPELQAVEAVYQSKGWARPGTLGHSDPPEHTRYRRMVLPWFSPARMRNVKSHIVEVVEELLDDLQAKGSGRVCDFQQEFSVPMPIYVFAGQLGVPREEMHLFERFGDAGIEAIGFDVPLSRRIELAHIGVEEQHYFAAKVDWFRLHPADILISDLANARDENGAYFSIPEILSMINILVLGGNETTTNALSLALWLVCREGLQRSLRKRPSSIPAFVEEALRFHSPVHFINRITTAEIVLGGKQIPARSRVMISFASANRDEAIYADADLFRLDRMNERPHLAFGAGIKHCIGAPLARLELNLAFSRLLARTNDVRLATNDFVPTLTPHPIAPSVQSLPVIFSFCNP